MKTIIYLIKREFKLFLTNTTLISVFFLAPLIYAFIIGFTYKEGKVTDIPVLVVNQDNSPLSLQLEEMLADNQSIKVIHHRSEPVDLKNEVIRQDAAAVVIIPERFEAMVLQKKYPEVNVHINTANVLTANFASKALQLTLGTFSAGVEISALQKSGMSAEEAMSKYEAFKVNYITMFNTSSNYLIFMWPAMMAVVLQQVILLAMAVSFSEELKRKAFVENFVERKSYAIVLMIIKCLPIWIFSLFNILVFFIYSKYLMIPSPVDFWNFMLVTGVFVVACTNLGVFFSILIPNSLKATQVLMVMASPAFIISGFTWPIYAMPNFIQNLTDIIPLTPYLESLKIMVIQQGSNELTHPYLWHLLIMAAIYFILGWIVLKFKLLKMHRLYNSNNRKNSIENKEIEEV